MQRQLPPEWFGAARPDEESDEAPRKKTRAETSTGDCIVIEDGGDDADSDCVVVGSRAAPGTPPPDQNNEVNVRAANSGEGSPFNGAAARGAEGNALFEDLLF